MEMILETSPTVLFLHWILRGSFATEANMWMQMETRTESDGKVIFHFFNDFKKTK